MHVRTRIGILVLVLLLLHTNVVRSRGGRSGGGRSGSGSRSRGSSSGGSSRSGSLGSSRVRGGGASSFVPGTGIGSVASSNNFKSVLTGAAAGYLTYSAGRSLISLAAAPMMWNSRAYYWGSSYYIERSELAMCSMLLNASDPVFKDVFFEDGTRPKQIVWGCKEFEEDCCGFECCPQEDSIGIFWIIVGYGNACARYGQLSG